MEQQALPAPAIRCLTKEQAAAYLGIGVTLLAELGVPAVKFGRRLVYDRIDLDAWLEEYKRRGRVREEQSSWPVARDSTGGRTLASGGSMLSYRTASDYAKVLGLTTERKPKPT